MVIFDSKGLVKGLRLCRWFPSSDDEMLYEKMTAFGHGGYIALHKQTYRLAEINGQEAWVLEKHVVFLRLSTI